MQNRMHLTIEDSDGLQLVEVTGELDAFAAQSFRERLGIVAGSDRLVIDLSGVSFVDSAGLHALFRVGRDAKESGARIAFVVPSSSPVRRVIEIVQLGELAPVCESLEAALARLPAADTGRGFRPRKVG